MHNPDDHLTHRNERHWRKFEAMARRGFGGWGFGPGPGGPGRGDWGGFGDSFRIGRMLASGDLRLVALFFIEQQPRHGYDLIKAIEDKTGGIYVPSPGVIYPALTFLEEAGYVTSTPEANKVLYTITEQGKAHLSDNRTAVETTLEYLARIGEGAQHIRARWEEAERHMREHGPRPDHPHHGPHDAPQGQPPMEGEVPPFDDARRDFKEAVREARRAGPEIQRRVAEILARAAAEIRRQTRRGPGQV